MRPLVARAAAKQRAAGGKACDALREMSQFAEEKAEKERHIKPHWDVLLKWTKSQEEPMTPGTFRRKSEAEIKKYGVGPWEEESPAPTPEKSKLLDSRGRPQLAFNTAFKRPGPYTPGFSP